MSEAQELNYESAFEELQRIMSALQNEEISVDSLSEKVKRASELLKFCHDKLRDTEKEVGTVIKDLGL
ncbi:MULTISPECIES: exodeoxyribonuclease VII small subunit [Croceimicrobium]|uniref:Exodeoxyribonuclease VII small subunit n=1 Tax=Croceimicrobium hydrocarbonivorans TaxID=2761580 RepID=A0A7H0VDU1_9FLAO|nr:exodeoxyribonuclease VII small subunit [Croceimicrobium hydrocarbonivorans]QNR23889.1 exodeoxyribonuclease VII small subunit [Croceimicrobium hydrocarbonivorans]|tara:strand:- start:634 stop:837 length:204 start_codon:yes stop_codon:yes gene_type:complete